MPYYIMYFFAMQEVDAMGKNETVSIDTLGRIAVAMECAFDDIVEIQ